MGLITDAIPFVFCNLPLFIGQIKEILLRKTRILSEEISI
jgi:hypothetical protein